MPIERELIIFKTLETQSLPRIQPGTHQEIPLAHATIHAFCDPTDNEGSLSFSRHIEDLTILIDDELKIIEPDQLIRINKEKILICDDEKAVTFQHSNVLARFQKNVSAKET